MEYQPVHLNFPAGSGCLGYTFQIYSYFSQLSAPYIKYTPRCAAGTLGIWSEVICRGGPGYRTDILHPVLRPRSSIGLLDICSMSGAQRSSMEALVGSYLTTQNFQISEPTQGSPERVWRQICTDPNFGIIFDLITRTSSQQYGVHFTNGPTTVIVI